MHAKFTKLRAIQNRPLAPPNTYKPVMPLVGEQGAHPEFGSSVNPITTRGADYSHHITASPPGFENPATSLQAVLHTRHTYAIRTRKEF
jgi:hypothetical protein